MKKTWYVLLIALCILLGGVCAMLLMSEDDTAPKFQFATEDLVYTLGDDWDVLLEGVTAYDEVDGDVTEQILIESVIPDKNDEAVSVVYVVKDKSNNVAKVSRRVECVSSTGETGEADTPDPDVTPTPTPTPTVDPFAGLSEEAPRLTLSVEKMTVKVGATVNRLALVKEITDDKDSKNYLWEHIHIEGDKLNTSKAGTYNLIYYVKDSDGNRSNRVKLTIVVE